MTYDADAPTTVLEFEHLRSRQRRRRQTERNTSNQAMTPAIKMLIGDWHVDELGIMTREIKTRDQRSIEGQPAGAGNEARKRALVERQETASRLLSHTAGGRAMRSRVLGAATFFLSLQLFNVLRGELSIIGPPPSRCPNPLLNKVKPGIVQWDRIFAPRKQRLDDRQ